MAIVHSAFGPDSENCGRALYDLAAYLTSKHIKTIAISSKSPGPLKKSKLKIDQNPLLQVYSAPTLSKRNLKTSIVTNALILGALCFFVCCKEKPRVLIFSTSPPVILALIINLIGKIFGAKTVYACMDIHPEIAVSVGEIRDGILSKILMTLDMYTARSCDLLMAHSSDMANSLKERGGRFNNIKLVKHGSPIEIDSVAIARREKCATTEVIFAGNFGRFQNLDLIIDAMLQIPQNTPIHFTFLGTGISAESLKSAQKLRPTLISVLPSTDAAQAHSLMQNADFGLVSLAPEIYRFAYPGKISGYLAANLPLAALIEPGCDIGKMIVTSGCGIVCGDSSNPAAVADFFCSLILSAEERKQMQMKCSQVYHQLFSREVVMKTWLNSLRPLMLD